MKLYESDQSETCVPVTVVAPVLSDARFEYIKDELLSLLKRENSLIAVYNNDAKGIQLLKERIEAEKALKPKVERSFDPDASVDRAQTNYAAMYDEILQKAPGLESLVNYAKRVKPAQWGEIDNLTAASINGDQNAKARLFDAHLRYAMRMALWASERYSVDLEDAIQESCIGLLIAINKYHSEYDGTFGNYAPFWMRQNMMRELPIAEKISRLPVHFFDRFMPIVDWVKENEYRFMYDEAFWEEAIGIIRQTLNCDAITALKNLALAMPPVQIDELVEAEDLRLSDDGAIEMNMYKKIDANRFRKIVNEALDQLKPREADVFRMRLGWGCDPMTLEEIGATLGVTRERIRQIEKKAIRKLYRLNAIQRLRDYSYLLD